MCFISSRKVVQIICTKFYVGAVYRNLFYPENARISCILGLYCLYSDLCTWDLLWFQTMGINFSSCILNELWIEFSHLVGVFSFLMMSLKLGSIKWHLHQDLGVRRTHTLSYWLGFWVDAQGSWYSLRTSVYGVCTATFIFVLQSCNWSGAFMLTKVGVVKRLLLFNFFFVHTCCLCYLCCACAILTNAADAVFCTLHSILFHSFACLSGGAKVSMWWAWGTLFFLHNGYDGWFLCFWSTLCCDTKIHHIFVKMADLISFWRVPLVLCKDSLGC